MMNDFKSAVFFTIFSSSIFIIVVGGVSYAAYKYGVERGKEFYNKTAHERFYTLCKTHERSTGEIEECYQKLIPLISVINGAEHLK